MENNLNQQMIETTDCLEAASVMKTMKNLWFWVLLICLLALQLLFWLKQAGLMDKALKKDEKTTNLTIRKDWGIAPLAASTVIEQEVEHVVQKASLPQQEAPSNNETKPTPSGSPTPLPPVSDEMGEGATQISLLEKLKQQELELFRIEPHIGKLLVRIFNFGALVSGVLYCLCLLMILKISLTSRLGGINHICRAFFWSLFLLALLVPWQTILQGVMVGILYLPDELFSDYWVKDKPTAFWLSVFYLRFCGLWLVGIFLLANAQSRSMKWANAVLRRLGMAR